MGTVLGVSMVWFCTVLWRQMDTQLETPADPAWLQEVTAFFAEQSPLARQSEHYLTRAGQVDMAQAVAQAIERSGCLVVEAGTGVGKTWAYLVPALLSGKRVLLSTATKTLQDQLFGKDLPTVARAVGRPLRMSLLKGRSSYLCLHRMEQAWQRLPATDRYLAHQLRSVEQWATATTSGDLAELHGVDERSEILPWVTSTRDNCLGSNCPRFKDCHLYAARSEAMAADVVVVNHHLFFADGAVRATGVAELLPSVDVAVFDEAHQLLDVVVQFLGRAVSSQQLLDWGRDVLLHTQRHARGLRDWAAHVAALEQAVQALRSALPPGRSQNERSPWWASQPEDADPSRWMQAWESLREGVLQTTEALRSVEESSPDLQRVHDRGLGLSEQLQAMAQPADVTVARWVEVAGAQFRLQCFPLEVGQTFSERVLGAPGAGKTWVFTSATLGMDEGLTWFTRPLGLEGRVTTLRVSSPFDYAHQAAVFVPTDLPLPAQPDHPQALAQKVWPWIMRLGGRTLVLTTTLRALQTVGQALRHWSERDLGPEVWLQGDEPKRDLLARFKRAGSGQGPGVVLVASASFWEGVDLPGHCLQLLVIDKLPFPPPDDPWTEARSRALKAAGISPFKAYFLPETAVALRQGAGRLIRTETDKGLLVLGDRRLLTMPYGRPLLAALPPMRWLDQESELLDWLDELVTTASTKDLPWL
jgi:ATP-dependent DNA helicase DinG